MNDEEVKEILCCLIDHIRPDGTFMYFTFKETDELKRIVKEYRENKENG